MAARKTVKFTIYLSDSSILTAEFPKQLSENDIRSPQDAKRFLSYTGDRSAARALAETFASDLAGVRTFGGISVFFGMFDILKNYIQAPLVYSVTGFSVSPKRKLRRSVIF